MIVFCLSEKFLFPSPNQILEKMYRNCKMIHRGESLEMNIVNI
jgi:hypothetical protein